MDKIDLQKELESVKSKKNKLLDQVETLENKIASSKEKVNREFIELGESSTFNELEKDRAKLTAIQGAIDSINQEISRINFEIEERDRLAKYSEAERERTEMIAGIKRITKQIEKLKMDMDQTLIHSENMRLIVPGHNNDFDLESSKFQRIWTDLTRSLFKFWENFHSYPGMDPISADYKEFGRLP